MSHVRLYERPEHSGGPNGLPELSVAGSFGSASPGLAYEGRVNIVNPAGDCTVKQLSGELPPGAALYVDNVTHQVVVTWPAYQESAAPIANPGFEAGDVGWEKGAGWTITGNNPPSGAKSGQYTNNGGDSLIINSARADCSPGTVVNFSCNVRQGASSAGNAGACSRLEFLSATGVVLRFAEGTLVNQGANNEVKPSAGSSVAPEGTTKVRIGARGFRKRQNRAVYVDDFTWDVTQAVVGTNVTGSWCISLEVKDSLGRTAQWDGCILVVSGLWVATNPNDAGDAGISDLMTSPDLETWTTIQRSPADVASQAQIAAVGGRAIIFRKTSSTVELIDNLASGEVVEVPGGAFANQAYDLLSYNDGAVLISQYRTPSVPGALGGNPRALVSFDRGETWTTYALPNTGSSNIFGRLFMMPSGRWVCTGAGNTAYYTDNSVPTGWVSTSFNSGDYYSHIQFDDGSIFAHSNTSGGARTTTGGTWTSSTDSLGDWLSAYTATIAIGNVGILKGANAGGYYFRTEDRGVTWTKHSGLANGRAIQGFVYGNGIIAAWDDNGNLYKSIDLGLSWTAVALPGNRGAPAIGFVETGDSSSPGIWN